MAIRYSGHCRSGSANPAGRVPGTIFSSSALTPKADPQPSASHSGRTARGPQRAAARQPASTAASPAASGSAAVGCAVSAPPCGRATARKPATPTAQQATPASSTRSGRRRRMTSAAISTANSRLSTSSGCTSVSEPKCSASTWSPAPATFTTIAARNSGRRSRLTSSRGDSAARSGTCLVLRSSSTDAEPNAAAASRPRLTAMTPNMVCPPQQPDPVILYRGDGPRP